MRLSILMARIARVVVPGIPHHVTQRGSRRMVVFESSEDYSAYATLLAEKCRQAGVQVWAYCLMPNHVHCVAVPESSRSLSLGFGKTHERYARLVNQRNGWTGHLWQERFFSVPMDMEHTLAAVRYVLQNPVRAGLVSRAQDWPHSSTCAHLGLVEDSLIQVEALAELVDDWQAFLAQSEDATMQDALRRSTRSGRPVGEPAFLAGLENRLGRRIRRKSAGRPQIGEVD